MSFAADVYVTGSNPNGLGVNVYLASGSLGGGGTTNVSGNAYVTSSVVQVAVAQITASSVTTITGTLPVTSSQANPVWITGTIATVAGAPTGTQVISGTVHVDNLPAVQYVTSSQAAPVWVTGVNLSVDIKNSTVSLSTTLGSTVGTGSVAPSTATLVGFVDGAGLLQAATGASGSLSVSVSNFPDVFATNDPVVPPGRGSAGVFPFQLSVADALLAANPSRIAFSVFNDSDGRYAVVLGPGASAAVWDFSLEPRELYESPYPSYTGTVTGIGLAGTTGTIRVKEMLP